MAVSSMTKAQKLIESVRAELAAEPTWPWKTAPQDIKLLTDCLELALAELDEYWAEETIKEIERRIGENVK